MMELAKSGKKLPLSGKSTKNEEKKSPSSAGSVRLASMADQVLKLKKMTEDPGAAAFAGQFAVMLAAMSTLKE